MYIVKAATLAFCLAVPVFASAATVSVPQMGGTSLTATVSGVDATAWAKADQAKSIALPASASWTTSPWTLPSADFPIDPAIAMIDDPCRNACSPYYGGSLGSYDPANVVAADGWQTTPFYTVFAPRAGDASFVNQAVLGFDRTQSAVSLLWGSPDASNLIEFFLHGTVVAQFWGADFGYFHDTDPGILGMPGRGAALLSLSGIAFDGLRFASWVEGGSFEFANIETAPAAVPLPAALPVLLSALAALALFAGRRRKAA